MTSIILSGACGKMGQVVAKEILKRKDLKIVAGVDKEENDFLDYKVYNDFGDLKSDVVIDFSNPKTLSKLLYYGIKTKTPLVIATTGYNDKELEGIKDASKQIPIFRSANMSMGISLMCELSKFASGFLKDNFDIEIVEKHHNQKIDSPSGTALMIADEINKENNDKYNYIYNRHGSIKKREKSEIGIHSIRGGTISGEHDVIFAGNDEVLTISHMALSKNVFAIGAINAALFIKDLPAGLYDMSSMIKNNIKEEVKI